MSSSTASGLRVGPRLPSRDPAWLPRLFWTSAALVLLWPLAVATEFRPWVLLEPGNLKVSAQFIGSFWPLALDGEFLVLVARETWRTVAIATAGITLALGVAMPLTLLSTRVLSISALSGRMARAPFWLRQGVRWLLIVLRSIPELVWALVFVRVVGLGPTAGVLAIAPPGGAGVRAPLLNPPCGSFQGTGVRQAVVGPLARGLPHRRVRRGAQRGPAGRLRHTRFDRFVWLR